MSRACTILKPTDKAPCALYKSTCATAEQIALLYDDQRDVTDPLPVPSEEALQADLDRETDPKTKSFKPADFVDLSFLREIEKSGFLAELYSKSSTR